MSCNIYYEDIIFTICYVKRNENKYYVFIGKVNNDIKIILEKIENRKNISSSEVIILKKTYPKYYMDWINIVKERKKIKFIDVKINIDDTINDIRKKIFIYLSDNEQKKYILPENQEIWLEKMSGKNKNEIIGYFYIDKNSTTPENKLIYPPHLYEKYTFANNDYLSFDEKLNKKNTSENNILIYDLLELDNDYNRTIIYFSDAKDEEEYLLKKNIKITNNVINKYFKKYWPYVNLTYDKNIIKNTYLLLKNYLDNENYVFNLINSVKIDKTFFGSCNILTVKFNITNDDNEDDDEFNDKSKYIDLFPIFDYIKTECISEKIPFIKYSEDVLESPFSIISKKAIDNGVIKKDEIKSWLGLNEDYREINGIILKSYIKDYNNEPKYSHISINRLGKIVLNISFKSDNNATFKDVEDCVINCKKILENINKHRVVKKIGEYDKIEVPNMEFKDNRVYFKNNTKLIFTNIIIPYNLNNEISIDFAKLEGFAKKFPFFITSYQDKKVVGSKNVQKSIKFKYKRISGFANMNEIMLDIDRLKQKYEKDIGLIIKTLEKKYQKSVDEIKSYILEWDKKYSMSKTSKLKSEFRTGILVTISRNNIVINGITKIYQIPLVYKFFVSFIHLFLHYDDYMKNKTFKTIFINKNLTKNVSYNQDYEFDNSATLMNYEISNYEANQEGDYDGDYSTEYDGNIDDMALYKNDLKDDFKNGFNNYNNSALIENNVNESISTSLNKISGLSTDSEIDINLKLTCNDPLPELDTCQDFCNDHKYFLRRLQRYDNILFKSISDKKNKKHYSFARKCQVERQPVILGYNPENNEKIKRSSYTYSVKYSSNPNNPRWYICPKIWCPYCQIPIDEGDINPKTIKVRATEGQGGTCKTAICPFGDHQVFMRDGDNEVNIYPGFVSKVKHPNGFCLPCCFKTAQNNPKSSAYPIFKKCIGDDIENQDIKDGQIYILAKGIPIEPNRYGKLPSDIGRILKTNFDTGYLGYKSGYLHKGIKHAPNNSFLSAICDILSCDSNNKLDSNKMKKILIEKLNIDLFRSLHSGNLSNIFHNPKDRYTPFENFKNYLLNPDIVINHIYLWDFLQRDGILYDNGINIFIFEDNNLLCPKGENISYFYDKTKKSILLIKQKEYYEPIYYLQGDGKSAKITCIFDYDSEEIMELFKISGDGCLIKSDIQWDNVLDHFIKKYDIKIDNKVINNGYDLQTAINVILLGIKNKKLKNNYMPILQYVDSYNKVFAIKLQNGLYLPVAPSKLIDKIKYKIVSDLNDIEHCIFKDVLRYSEEINKICKLNCNITHKVLDNKNKKNIIALVNANNRFIPIKSVPNTDKKLKVSIANYFEDVDESLENKIIKPDKRFEIINKKKYEDETFIRMKFDLSKYLNMKENKGELIRIIEIINDNYNKSLKSKDVLLNNVLANIFSKISTTTYKNNDYNDYIRPNKRIPCFLRYVNAKGTKSSKGTKDKNTKDDIKLSCEDDPHCIISGNSCKLYVNNKNLLKNESNHKNKYNYDNYNFYIAKIVDELLRYQFKRNEILNDDIPVIINKDIIETNPDKYIVIHTMNYSDINDIVEKLYVDNKNLFIDNRKLYEESVSKEFSFRPEKYSSLNSQGLINHSNVEDLSIFWSKILGYKYNVILKDEKNKLFDALVTLLNNPVLKTKNSVDITINILKRMTTEFLKLIISKKNNESMNKNDIINIYKSDGANIFKYITNFDDIIDEINSEQYKGCDADLLSISKIFNINIIILDKRIKKNSNGYKFYKSINKSPNFIILYKSSLNDINIYNIIQLKGKVIFKQNELPNKFIEYINNTENNS